MYFEDYSEKNRVVLFFKRCLNYLDCRAEAHSITIESIFEALFAGHHLVTECAVRMFYALLFLVTEFFL